MTIFTNLNKKTINLRVNPPNKFKHNYPKVTVITAVLNDAENLEKTILSVINQTYDNLEFIIIDGGSTDGTLDIIARYINYITNWVSEPDKGIADAFNKGITISTGDYINFQGSGDRFVDNNTIKKMLHAIDPSIDMFISGRVNRVTLKNKIIYTTKYNKIFSKESLLFKMSLPHQGLFTNKIIFNNFGLFDTNCVFSMDYELLLRIYKNFPGIITKNIIVSNWMEGGIGTDKTLEILGEYNNIKLKNKVAPVAVLMLINYWSLLKYHLKKLINFQ